MLARARLGHEAGWTTAGEDQLEAEAILAQVHASLEEQEFSEPTATTLSLADRFDGVLDWGRRIALALSPKVIYDEARLAALRLLRAEHCVVLRVEIQDGTPRFAVLAGAIPGRWNEERLHEAIMARKAVAFVEESPEVRRGTSGERSSLCVPLYVRGDLTACLYVTHEQVRGLFSSVEERLADYIVTIAGAALENADGFSQLQTLNQTLERRVAERTAAAESRAYELALSNQQLETLTAELLSAQRELTVAKQAAEAASEAKSRFLATMSHEIRTPLNGVIGMTELALSTSPTPQQRNYLNTAKESAISLLSLLNDVLDFSKIEASRMELETIPFSVREVVEDAARTLSVTAARKGLEVVCHVDATVPPRVLGDPSRLQQVLVNLIGNAIKFTPKGEVYVRVHRQDGADGGTLHFAVQDTGIGIPADKHQTIFEAFRQSDGSTTRRFGGTGLGLAITSQLVSLMGGKIGVQSEPGKGSTFHFKLPLPPVDAPPMTAAAAAQGRRYQRALLWSASEHHRQACASLLTYLGLEVELLPRDPLAGPRADEPTNLAADALLVIDVPAAGDMPFDLDELRAELGFDPSQVVVLLPAGQTEVADACHRLGFTRSLVKPPRARELASMLRTDEPGRAAASSAPLPSSCRHTSAKRSLRVLVADDSPVNQEVAAGLLELSGHSVATAATGREAVVAWEKEAFDVILMDLEMPDMDGLQATEWIRSREAESGRRTPIIALTAHALKGVRERCLAAGMDGCITKPLRPEQLLPLVASLAETNEGGVARDDSLAIAAASS